MDQLRGVAILLVVIFHAATIVSVLEPVPEPIRQALASLAPFRMPMLVFLSGMLLDRSLAKRAGAYFGGKVRGVLWPYALWTVIFLAIWGRLNWTELKVSVFVPPTYLWYLHFLFLFYVGAWVMRRLHIPMWVAIIAGFMVSFTDLPYRIPRFGFMMVFFFAGYYFARYGTGILQKHRAWLLLVAGATTVAGGTLSASGVPVQYEPLFVWVPAAGIVAAVLLAEWAQNTRPMAAFAWVGRDSLIFYVTHFPVMYIVARIANRAGMEDGIALYVIAAVSALAVGVAFSAAARRVKPVGWLFTWPPLQRDRVTSR